LQRIPISAIKIDRPLINGLPSHKAHKQFVRATIAMAHELGIKVIAEGVETEAQEKFLASIACDRAQGFYYGIPVSIEQLITWMSRGKVLPLYKRSSL